MIIQILKQRDHLIFNIRIKLTNKIKLNILNKIIKNKIFQIINKFQINHYLYKNRIKKKILKTLNLKIKIIIYKRKLKILKRRLISVII